MCQSFTFVDGSELVEIGYRGGDNYNYLDSADGQFSAIVTVNVDGKDDWRVVLRIRLLQNFMFFGSLLIDETNPYDNKMVTGMGSRFMWYSEKNMLRIGYVSSYYWDNSFSGDFSIVFGHSSVAKGDYSVVTGGFYNEVLDEYSIISGGYENIVSENNSIILGGKRIMQTLNIQLY